MSMERATSMPCPPDSPWALTDLIMEYMHRRFRAELFPTTDPKGILPDINIPAEMVCEADQMSEILAQACRNTGMCCFMVDPMTEPANHLPSYEQVWESLKHLEISLPQNIGCSRDTKKWQMDSILFWRDSKLAGTVNLLPTWFQQGHSVGAFPTFSWRHLI
ncbi:hypothetical protein PAXRUDRAFT_159545 [Paxillus rubicundulus Ve08.2h10]|uniref:Uncharacterized protein n=1 Tax=Paxillus rubicundulus Ve08.2h10 TaxID=930991 RepID=A0A0D0DG16_9AGAM|nr:hypothetical protein PAXRUDRAFT_159545 [Paxillus rubicundulus Ve08.2h10]